MSHTAAVRRWLVGALVGLAVVAPGAGAQVHVDPDSPSGHEYEIPLESARRQAEPGRDRSAPVPQGERSAPLFGEGITPKSQPQREQRSSGGERAPAKQRVGRVKTPAPAEVRLAAANPGAPAGGLGSTALVLLGGVLVLGAGVGAGLLARRASRP
jgi:hypothetical protein